MRLRNEGLKTEGWYILEGLMKGAQEWEWQVNVKQQ